MQILYEKISNFSVLIHLNTKNANYIITSDYFDPCLSHVIHPQWSVKPKLRVQSFSSHLELTHEVGKGGDTVPQFGVFLLSQ